MEQPSQPAPAPNTPQVQQPQMPKQPHKKSKHMMILAAALALLIVIGLGVWLIVRDDTTTQNDQSTTTQTTNDAQNQDTTTNTQTTLPTSQFGADYVLNDAGTGSNTTVTVANGTRTITTNALPNHATGTFPNSNNPNTISAQDVTYELTTNPVLTNAATFAREPGVAINGVKFEPQTAERVICTSGQTFSVEAIQDFVSLGLDSENAHVQPTGAYHYHGVSQGLVASAGGTEDIVHIGFALDGHLMYYSKSGAYKPSIQLSTTPRSGTGCTFTLANNTQDVTVEGTAPDGTYVSDWQYTQGSGDLDECNGITINGTYVYFITDEYPFIPRCLNGEFTSTSPGGAPSGSAPSGAPSGSQQPSGPPAGGQPPS